SGMPEIGMPLLKISNVTKHFGPTIVLDRVTFEIPANKVIGLVGENGAGKSTLLNILSGELRQDAGKMWLRGQHYQPSNYHEACQVGVGRAFQEQALILNVPVYENLLLGQESKFLRAGLVLDRKAMLAAAKQMVHAAGIDIDVNRLTRYYDFSNRQAIEVIRACLGPVFLSKAEHPLVLLDEPTSALAKEHELAFFGLVDQVKRKGAVVFVSHRISEVLDICDLIYVLKDGQLVATVESAETNEAELHSLMVGRARASDYYHETQQDKAQQNPVLLEVKSLHAPPAYTDVSLTVRAGEILGIGGLLGSGKSALAKGIMGLEPSHSGTVRFCQHEARKPEIRRSIRQGIAYVPAERMTEGLIGQFPLAWNISMASGHDLFSNALGRWFLRKEDAVAAHHIEALSIKSGTPRVVCDRLSGGNQQKVVLSRWLCRSPKLFVFDNPTRGVDVGAKEEIYRLVRSLTRNGMGVLLITDELLELIGLSHRIIIMRSGRVAAEVPAPAEAKPSEHDLLALMLPSSNPTNQHAGH
ncbi:MAG TPA: sugar ABC transporter ATP-binding protein, partial [Chthoniobacterales bacterium]|nr:sugar ABC transporter ATP-binding protein [Chthoniobacterales bacterium]